jgi:signal transduction histidine kinase
MNFIIGLFTLAKSHKKPTNIFFATLTVILIVWNFANNLSITTDSNDTAFQLVSVIITLVLIQLAILVSFMTVFPSREFLVTRSLLVYYVFFLITMALSITGNFFEGYEEASGVIKLIPSSSIYVFILFSIASITYIIYRVIIGLRSREPLVRQQYLLLTVGLFILLFIVPLTNFFLKNVYDINFGLRFSSVYTLAFASVIAYAIVRHGFFEIKAIVARSVAYVLLVGFFSALYGVTIYAITTIFYDEAGIPDSLFVVFTVLAVLFGFTFSPLKQVFDRFSNKVFYRDAYDPQVVLNHLSELLAQTIRLDEIMTRSSQIIQSSVRPEHMTFLVLDKGEVYRQESLGHSVKVEKLNSVLGKATSQQTFAIDLDVGNLKQVLNSQDIEAVIKLTTQDELVGYLLLGSKKSGNMFSAQDRRLLNIIANELSIAVQNARNFEQIQEFNLTLQKKIEDATHKLRNTNEKLKALDEAKDEFISMASHQLRTPLTSVKGYVSMVLEGDAGKITPRQEELLKSAFTSSQRMVYLISDLLNVSRLRTGKFVIEAKEIYMPDVVEGEVKQLEESAKNRKLKLVYKKPKNFPMVSLDETKIRQVIMNFADNAIYYTPAGGVIKIILEHDKNSITYKVVDNGIGVPKEDAHKLFTKFYRAGNAKKARPDGTGLGLFMAKKVVVAQGGAILFSSTPGKGSTFGFTFPLDKIATKKSK